MLKSQLIKNQKKKYTKNIIYNDIPCKITVTLRYDDECNNGHNTFAITGSIEELNTEKINKTICFGCIHEEIEKYFPEFKYLIKWHLCNSDAPMYYLENTLYHASNSKSSKYKVGQPNQWAKVLKFKDSNITHKFDIDFINFLENNKKKIYKIIPIEHKKDASYNYKPKYTFEGFNCEWYQCPFDTKEKATEFKKELAQKEWTIKKIVIGHQEGKERDFTAARRSAIWDDATEKQLSLPRKQLKKLLLNRLPKLMEEFKHDMETLGFTY